MLASKQILFRIIVGLTGGLVSLSLELPVEVSSFILFEEGSSLDLIAEISSLTSAVEVSLAIVSGAVGGRVGGCGLSEQIMEERERKILYKQ
jgi:hypothetical protein